jgi:hypothetical protein
MSIPNREDIVQAVSAAHPHLIQQNTRESITELLWRTVSALAQADARFGFLSKSPGENHVEIPGAGLVAIDAVAFQGEHNVVDIFRSAGDGPGTGSVGWGETDERRDSNLWVKAVPFVQDLPNGDPNGDTSKRLEALEQALKQVQAESAEAARLAGQARAQAAVAQKSAEDANARIGKLRVVANPDGADAISTNTSFGHSHQVRAKVIDG